VIGAFVAVCVAAVLYVLLNPKKSFAAMPVIDESQILVHNGATNSAFQQGTNSFFTVSRKFEKYLMDYRIGHSLMPKLSSKILYQTQTILALANRKKTKNLLYLRSLTGEKCILIAFNPFRSKEIALLPMLFKH
jgi:hypothetical protein